MTAEKTAEMQAQALDNFAAFLESPITKELLDRYTIAQVAAGARNHAARLRTQL